MRQKDKAKRKASRRPRSPSGGGGTPATNAGVDALSGAITADGEAEEWSGEGHSPDDSGARAWFPIVAVGASTGGLEAFAQLLAHLPADSGMAFVFIQHLDPSHKSLLVEVLAKATRMPVAQAGARPCRHCSTSTSMMRTKLP